MQFDWAEMPTRPRIAGRERRVYAVLASLPFSGAQTAHFSLEMTTESFLEGHVRGHYPFHTTACTPATPREKGSVEAAVRYLKSGFWPARRFSDQPPKGSL